MALRIVKRWRRHRKIGSGETYFLPSLALFLESVEDPPELPEACAAFLAFFSSSAFLSLRQPQMQEPDRERVRPSIQDSTVVEPIRDHGKRNEPLAALLRGEAVPAVLGVGLPRRRALAVALPLAAPCAAAHKVKDETEQDEEGITKNINYHHTIRNSTGTRRE